MLKVFEIAEESFQLVDGRGKEVGWIRGSALGFSGLLTEKEAIAAAVAGSSALGTFLQRSFGAPATPPDPGAPLRVVHDGAYDWVSRGSHPLARLYRPGTARNGDGHDGSYRVEFVLPSYARAAAAIGAAQQVHRAIESRAEPTGQTAASSARATPLQAR